MKRLLLYIICLFPLPLLAQHLQLRAGGGLAKHYGSSEWVGAYKIGVGYELELSQTLTFTPAFEFVGKGWKRPDEQVAVLTDEGQPVVDEQTSEPVKSLMNRSATALYLQVPLLLNCYLRTAPSQYVVLSAGPYVAYGVGGKQKTKGDGTAIGSRKYFYEDNTFDAAGTKRFDAGLVTMLGYQFASSLTLGVEAECGLAKFNASGRKNMVCMVALSYAF